MPRAPQRAVSFLRKQAILFVSNEHPDVDLEAGLAELVEQGLLKHNESRDFYFLTAEAAERLGAETAA